MTYLFKKISQFLLPTVCVLCQAPAKQDFDLCYACEQDLPWIQKACSQCGLPLFQVNERCGQCLKQPPAFDKTFALFYYKEPIRQLITHLKFHEKLIYACVLGELMAKKMAHFYSYEIKPDCIIPVPLHSKRLKERGFNQALELARPIGKKLKIPLLTHVCKRILYTKAQSAIPAKNRKNNLKKAFLVSKDFKAERILVVDDVMTTGYTLAELSRTLKKNHIKHIDVCCAARTVRS